MKFLVIVLLCFLPILSFASTESLSYGDFQPKLTTIEGSFARNLSKALVNNNSIERDLNENFFNSNFDSHEIVWDSDLQTIQNLVESRLVLPTSLVRSFVYVAEKRLHSISKTSKFPTVQILVSEAGVNGVTDLVNQYAMASGRPMHLFHSVDRDLIYTLLPSISEIIQQEESPVIVLDSINRNSDSFLDKVIAILMDKSLLGNASLILTVDLPKGKLRLDPSRPVSMWSILGETQFDQVDRLQKLFRLVDSFHFVRNPNSISAYENIIKIMFRDALLERNKKRSSDQKILLKDQDILSRELAEAAFAIQSATGVSLIGGLHMLIFSPFEVRPFLFKEYLSCSESLSSDKRSLLDRFYAAAEKYREALRVGYESNSAWLPDRGPGT
ncbi:MAG: hypothetical protein KDD40_03380 [Bdellovibrionales bacterium]|nr:hypothetical protein [Bdellovibrionales bacterium]